MEPKEYERMRWTKRHVIITLRMIYISSNNVRHPVTKIVWARDFVFSKSLELLWGPPNLLRGCWIYLTGAKRLGLEVNHSPRSSVEVKKQWSYTCMPPYTFDREYIDTAEWMSQSRRRRRRRRRRSLCSKRAGCEWVCKFYKQAGSGSR